MQQIAIGTAHTSHLTVEERHTAQALGSGNLPVLGTPAMTALMENAAMEAIAPHLDATESSVGIALNITHDRASRVGEPISATATVTATEGRRYVLTVQAADSERYTIGQGTHSRFVIDVEKFMSKIEK